MCGNSVFFVSGLFSFPFAGLKGNPLPQDILSMYNEPKGTHRLLTFLLDNLNCEFPFSSFINKAALEFCTLFECGFLIIPSLSFVGHIKPTAIKS
jgi:hypothetical protein